MRFSIPIWQKQDEYTWHKWYAWRPVRAHTKRELLSFSDYQETKPNDFVWFAPVYRRLHFYSCDMYSYYEWIYTLDSEIENYGGSWNNWIKK